jgi:hypothetical protein
MCHLAYRSREGRRRRVAGACSPRWTTTLRSGTVVTALRTVTRIFPPGLLAPRTGPFRFWGVTGHCPAVEPWAVDPAQGSALACPLIASAPVHAGLACHAAVERGGAPKSPSHASTLRVLDWCTRPGSPLAIDRGGHEPHPSPLARTKCDRRCRHEIRDGTELFE